MQKHFSLCLGEQRQPYLTKSRHARTRSNKEIKVIAATRTTLYGAERDVFHKYVAPCDLKQILPMYWATLPSTASVGPVGGFDSPDLACTRDILLARRRSKTSQRLLWGLAWWLVDLPQKTASVGSARCVALLLEDNVDNGLLASIHSRCAATERVGEASTVGQIDRPWNRVSDSVQLLSSSPGS